jgi:hypothetical protein
MSLTYSTYINSIANLMPVPTSDSGFQTMASNMIDDAEQDLYRTLDLLNTVTRDSTAALTAGNRNFTLPSSIGTFVVTQDLNVITPAGTTNPDAGTRNPLTPITKEALDFMWPSSTGSAVPTYFAPVTQGVFVVGAWPDQAYQVEVVGTIRPVPLSVSNTTTLLSVYFPDLLVARSMVFAAAYMKNFGAAVDDPKSGVTWQAHYEAMLHSAQTEEARKKFMNEAWSDKTAAMAGSPRV